MATDRSCGFQCIKYFMIALLTIGLLAEVIFIGCYLVYPVQLDEAMTGTHFDIRINSGHKDHPKLSPSEGKFVNSS